MDRFGTTEFRELVGVNATPAISIYMPVERREMTGKVNRLKLRGHLEEAERRIKAAEVLDAEASEALLKPMYALVEDRDFWNQSGEGVAIFVSPEFQRVYWLPRAFEEEVVVGDNFHTRPLLGMLATPANYWVLAVGEEQVNFWEGSVSGASLVEVENLPSDLHDALQLEEEKDQDGLMPGSANGPRNGRPGGFMSPMVRGHGGGRDQHKAYLKQYFTRVSEAIADYLGEAQGPLILAAVDFCHPIFHDAARSAGLSQLVESGIEGNVHFWSDAEIHQRAWPIVEAQALARVERALELWERSYGKGSAEIDLSQVARRVAEGRVHMLLLDESAQLRGDFDREMGQIHELEDGAEESEQALAKDVYDELAEVVIEMGGEVVVLPHEKMPSQTGLGAILRGGDTPMTTSQI
ncbi:hypothetical protein DV096_15245 [Bradymonadaceae bacterium TMQ3]|uniref:Chemotaxis protein n=1 Tax=Lujinxingia sediminis TaxID=2480984 RepID=A0ABY0CUY5_9DELT|nr:hypothetical protein [Lujinxingia sediminis]RDV37328.1 hypothetical protein DV096_15245 [Bradymonadaceae bacterium TMQ3]RVU46723.1 hypothetical protein EA187_06190 [Lujinxingia sediminis]TXC74734.1 hypothetical protein FRC91_14335 [Bradymonadales bacterium TMQ1]